MDSAPVKLRGSKLKMLIWLSVLFVAGWCISIWMSDDAREQILTKGGYLLAGVILIHGSWRVVPAMLIGFIMAEGLAWAMFYSSKSYYPDANDVTDFGSFGCAVAALFGSGWLMSRQNSGNTSISATIKVKVTTACFALAILLLGGYVRAYDIFAMDGLPPELVGATSVLLCTTAILCFARLLSPRLDKTV